MRRAAIGLLVPTVFLTWVAPQRAAESPEAVPLADKVRQSIEEGIRYLRATEGGRGNLEKDLESRNIFPGGLTALATFALLSAGVPPDDLTVQRCLTYLRTVPAEQTYVVALQTMAYAAARQTEDKDRLQKNVDWLLQARRYETVGGVRRLKGWSYRAGGTDADNSNTQYAVLGLHEGQVAGATIDPQAWVEIREYYTRHTGEGDAVRYRNWGYKGGNSPIPTMTAAALCGMSLARTELDAGAGGGAQEENVAVRDALKLIDRQMPHTTQEAAGMPHPYYWLAEIERVGRLSGQHYLGGRDWYRLGCEFLLERQKADGSWQGEMLPVVATSFALLFLVGGRTPVLVSRLAFGPEADQDPLPNDARRLVAFANRELFRKQRLAWQIFDARRAGGLTRERIERLTAELLESPVAYLSGDKAPRLEAEEEQLLQRYLERGGFLYADARGGSAAFDKGFRELMSRLFPKTPLQRLPADHPLWRSARKFSSLPTDHELWGIETGGRTVVVYSPEGLSGSWERDQSDRGKGEEAFRLGANVIAYATGLKPPRPRLSEVSGSPRPPVP
jgi:hypothetical protein